MKVRIVLLLFLIMSCSVDTENSKIEIEQSIFNSLKLIDKYKIEKKGFFVYSSK